MEYSAPESSPHPSFQKPAETNMKIFFSVGEPSGDLHGANLIRELRKLHPDVECVGYGGPKMVKAGFVLHEDLTKLALMWVLRVVLNIHKFWNLLQRADRYFSENQLDAVVLIDYPGFNWWIARKAKKHKVPVFYYGAPQMWGWAPWRIKKMKRLVDHVLCKLPFEEKWYSDRGCKATFVGHPYFDEMHQQTLDSEFINQYSEDHRPLITILPGSRTQEVTRNLKWFLKTAAKVREQLPDIRFAIASFNKKQAIIARCECEAADIQADVFVGRTPELVSMARCCMACSGSVSLELLYNLKPTVILYQIRRVDWVIQALIRQVKYITLVNLLYTKDIRATSVQLFDPDATGAERVPFPEYVSFDDKSSQMASHIHLWATSDQELANRVEQLRELKSRFCIPGASRTAAEYITRELEVSLNTTRRISIAA